MSRTLETEIANHYRGLKRRIARDTTEGRRTAKVGKDPMPFDLYRFVAKNSLLLRGREFVFARTFMIMTWNLMCRSSNTVNVKFGHMEWKDDSLRVFFGHQKNDQFGDKPKDPRHIYANPLHPEICPILALAIYWAVYSFSDSDRISEQKLFPGNGQYDRFGKTLEHFWETEQGSRELNRRGMSKTDIGSHSLRKGAATYCSSGSTACPSPTAIALRAGWALAGVQGTYMRYEAAGDMYVGRTVSGLPINDASFALLPPHFSEEDTDIDNALAMIYPRLPGHLRYIVTYCLASLVYHREYLENTIHSGHALRASPIFTNNELYRSLKSKVICGFESTTLIATGS
jgi:hypothetical protein